MPMRSGRVDAAGVVEHQEAAAEGLLLVVVDGALILRELLPPLGALVVDGEQGLVGRLPLVGLSDIALRPRQSDVQRFAHGLVAGAVAADIGHPVVLLVFCDGIAAAPRPVDECRETAALVHVPPVGLVGEQAPLGLPVQQVVAAGEPRLVAAPVVSILAVVDDVGHHPLAVRAEHRGAVYLVVVVRRGHHHAVFIGCAYLVVDALHLLLTDILCRYGETREN